jgi:rubrerythrin
VDFFDFAKQIETDGKRLYSRLADEIPVEELSGIFRFLAAEDTRHFELFEAWQHQLEKPEAESNLILGEPEEIFKKAAKAFETPGVPVLDYSDAYRKALTFEKENLKAYEGALDRIDDPGQRQQLLIIIEQEKTHVSLLTSLLDFCRHPGEWIENAEVRHSEEY